MTQSQQIKRARQQSRRQARRMKAALRAAGITLAVVIMVSGVTFAALQSQQNVLAGNTITTATASLQLSTDGTTFGNSREGFAFANIIPGGPAMPVAGHAFYLKNSGGTPLTLKLAVTTTPSNLDGVDLAKVNILLTTVGSGTGQQSFNLQSLVGDGVAITGNNLPAGTTQQYKLMASMAADAVNGGSASLGNIDFAISGQAVSN